jgi:pimeloyl-ACP methyl ester carboxylesterase
MPTPSVRLWSAEAGAGKAVLCISGLGYSSWCWREAAQRLSRTCRVITFDNRGTGRSDSPEDGYSIEQFADDAAAVLMQHRISTAHVIGHSMGGYIALTLAVRHSSLVNSLTLVGTSSGGDGSLPVPEATLAAWKAASALPPERFARETMPWSFATGWSDAHSERFEQLLQERIACPTAMEVWKKQFRAAGLFGRDGLDVSTIAVPAVVVHGTDDRVVPYANGVRLARQLPNARLATIDGGGHLVFLEQPEEFHGALMV